MRAPWVFGAALIALSGCGGDFYTRDAAWLDGSRRYAGEGAISIAWTQRLTATFDGPYVPVERAIPALDPAHDRVYVGSTSGVLYAMSSGGQRLARYDAKGAIESQPALDVEKHELYVGTEQGEVCSLDSLSFVERFRANAAGGAIRSTPVLSGDAVYVVTDMDEVVAISREDGEILWRYRRDAPEGFTISGHAGLVLAGNNVVTGFTDGVVVALDASDGTIAWERDTSVDVEPGEDGVPRFLDVDTTPVRVGDTLYVASFSAGLYGLEVASGSVAVHDARFVGVTGLAYVPNRSLLGCPRSTIPQVPSIPTERCDEPGRLVLTSVDEGVVSLNVESREIRWRRPVMRGSPTVATVSGNTLLLGESLGSFVAISLDDGRELARFEAGHGFSAAPAVAGRRGFVVSNGGSLFAFHVHG